MRPKSEPSGPSKPWFAPKRYGYGAGLPIAWQGWAVLAIYMVIVIGATSALPYALTNPAVSWPVIAGIVIVATIIMVVICARTTRGGWRWRNGDDD